MGWRDTLARRRAAPAETPVAARLAAALDASQRGDYGRALEIWGPLAHDGVARAQNNIGACFAEGLGIARDPQLAVRWLELSAHAGDPVGQRNLAAGSLAEYSPVVGVCTSRWSGRSDPVLHRFTMQL